MTVDEGATHIGCLIDSRDRRLGSRQSRLAEAEKQLAIVLDGVDLDAEPELGDAVTDAVSAVHRASSSIDDTGSEGTDSTRRGTFNWTERASPVTARAREQPGEAEPVRQP